MAFTNLPPNLQDMFNNLQDQINKLVTGPNQAMYYAQSAQSTADSAQGNALAAQTAAAAANAQALIAQSQAIYAQATASAAQTSASIAQSQATIASAQAVTAQATANTAYLAANVASAQAITAQNTANAAASQATIAQSQATIASTQATTAQTTANGKNSVYYSTSTPGTTANKVGDIWYQYGTVAPYINKVIAQWTGAGGTSWTSVTVSGLVIANIDAGSITTGTLSAIQISAGSGTQAFNVSSTGYMSAQGAYIKGNITADSGTFNGQVNATSGYFGSATNGWQINSTGITGLGSGYIAGGTIQGTNFNNGNGTFYVNSTGDLVAQSVYVKGAVLGTSGYFGSSTDGWNINNQGITGVGAGYIAGGTIQGTTFTNGNGTFYVNSSGALVAQSVYIKGAVLGTSGYFGNASNGWNIDTNGITGIGSGYIAGGAIQGTTITGGTLQTGTSGKRIVITSAGNIDFYSSLSSSTQGQIYGGTFTISGNSAGTLYIYSPSVSGSTQSNILLYSYLSGATSVYGMYMNGNVDFNNDANVAGELRAVYGANNTVTSAANVWISTTGQIRKTTASSERYKTDIVNLVDIPELDPKMLYALPVRAFRYKNEFLSETDDRYNTLIPGFIAEEIDAIYPQAADYENGNVESWNHRTLIPAMLALIQDQEKRIKLLEGK